MSHNVKVIFSKCIWNGKANSWQTWGEWIGEHDLKTLTAARRLGDSLIVKGLSVIVRPTYNEKDVQGRFYREWRSFSGEPFKEVRFSF